jgi:hypothetical protein
MYSENPEFLNIRRLKSFLLFTAIPIEMSNAEIIIETDITNVFFITFQSFKLKSIEFSMKSE